MPIRWPEGWPNNTLKAMRAAIFAQSIGRAVAFSLAAFRQAFAGGKDLSDVDNVLIAAAACELHPNAILKALETQSVKDKLREATAEAYDRGVRGVPTIAVGDELFYGDDRLEEAASALRRGVTSRREAPQSVAKVQGRSQGASARRRCGRRARRLASAAHAAAAVARRMRDRFGGEPDPPRSPPNRGNRLLNAARDGYSPGQWLPVMPPSPETVPSRAEMARAATGPEPRAT